ncbi:acetate--CoA ligase family protein [Acuticoccus mangrovi]|uniref:Acetate--CoA ligase family protein n=1 Tax=Acuticoccus mangrovi TaxID=2796142 RepID=A0A934IK44_9HYPH|nr:acetate--CoA ligase family protein [Acuticoccus mangrovi]
MTTDPELLSALTAPGTVALVGASDNPKKLTSRPQRFLTANGFAGRIVPVNPGRDTVLGLPAAASVDAIEGPVDHAYVMTAADAAIAAVEACAAKGVKVVSVLADGFAEAGPEGWARQERITAVAREAGMLLIGPNSMGVVNTLNGFVCTTNAAFRADRILKGRFAALSQSGSIIGTLLSRGAARGLGFSTLVSLGNEAVAGVGTLGRLLVDDPQIDGFLLFLETIRDPEEIAAFGRAAAAAGKPVVAYMIGRSDEGQALSVSHTGALTGSAEAVASFLAGCGILQVDLFDTLLDAPAALAGTRLDPVRPRTVTVVSTTGGGGAMVVDQMAMRGVTIAGASPAARRTLEAQKIPLGHGKLVDVTLAGAQYDTMKAVVGTLAADPATGVLVVAIGSSAQFDPELAVKPIVDAVAEAPEGAAPVLGFPLPHAPDSLRLLEEGGVPAFRGVESCAETVALLMRPPAPPPVPHAPLPAAAADLLTRSGVLDEVAAGEVFAALGVDRPAQTMVSEASEATGLAFPVVAKLVSPDLPHKTEAGAIRLGIGDADALAEAVEGMIASAEAHAPGFHRRGILVQEMVKGLGEALVGLTRDPLVGPMVTVGAGGVLAEIYRDAAVRPAPVDRATARAMVAEVKGFALLAGYRGAPRGDLEALAAVVEAVSRLAIAPNVAEAEINPVLVLPEGQGALMLDALIRLT